MQKNKKIKRIFHTWNKWECYPAGFYENQKEGMSKPECEEAYRALLSDSDKFETALSRVLKEWPNSCEHYLTNENMNRIAWLGQASLTVALGIPSTYRAGYFLLSKTQQQGADLVALKYLNQWLTERGHPSADLDGAGVSSIANIY